MRITIDIDTKNPFILCNTLIRGMIICRKFPKTIRRTRKGYHLIWSDLNLTEREMFKYRKVLGDDKNRIRLDMLSDKRLSQVLFSAKKVTYFNEDGSIKKTISHGDWT